MSFHAWRFRDQLDYFHLLGNNWHSNVSIRRSLVFLCASDYNDILNRFLLLYVIRMFSSSCMEGIQLFNFSYWGSQSKRFSISSQWLLRKSSILQLSGFIEVLVKIFNWLNSILFYVVIFCFLNFIGILVIISPLFCFKLSISFMDNGANFFRKKRRHSLSLIRFPFLPLSGLFLSCTS